MSDESESPASRGRDYLATVWIDDHKWAMGGNCFGDHRAEVLLVRCDKGCPLGVAIGVSGCFNKTLVGDLTSCREFAAF